MSIFNDAVSQTKPQRLRGSGAYGGWGMLNLITPAPSPTIATYREMRKVPTIALARAVATTPVLSAEWTYEVDDDVNDDTIVTNVRAFSERLRRKFLRDACFSMDFGWKPFEIIWGFDWSTRLLTPVKLKPLAIDRTEPILDDHGNIIGLKNYDVRLDARYMAWITYDGEDDDPYGRSIYENIREHAYKPWLELVRKQMLYITKVAGIIPLIEYPPGYEEDSTGAERSNFEIAKSILATLGQGNGVVMPNALALEAQTLLERGMSAEQIKAWSIKFIEASGQHGQDFVAQLRHHESGMMRGMLVPERAATEGSHGTKAEAETHASIAMNTAQLWSQELCAQWNSQVVDKYLEINYGREARGKVRAVAQPLWDERASMIRAIMQNLLQGNADLLEQWTDVDAMLEASGLPKAQEIVLADMETAREETEDGREQGRSSYSEIGEPSPYDSSEKLEDVEDGRSPSDIERA